MAAIAGAGHRIAAGAGYRIAVPASLFAAMMAMLVAVGVVIGLGQPLVLAVAALPLAVVVLVTLAVNARWLLVLLALGLSVIGEPVTDRFGVGPVNIWAFDIIVAIAVAGWFADWLSRPKERRPRLPRAAILGLPLLLFGLALLIGAERGHDRYGASLIGMPLRLVLYAAIATAITSVSPRQALRGLTFVFYGGVLLQAAVAAYHVASGTSATAHLNLSTGGIRYIGIGAATYMGAAVMLALLNLARARKHHALHLTVLALACMTVILAYTRTVWLIVGVEVLVFLLVSRSARRVAFSAIPVVVPFLIIAVLALASVKPDLITTFSERLSTPASQDSSVLWRTYAYRAVLSGVDEERLLGVGFGRTTSFSINNQPNYIAGDPHNGYIYVYAGGGLLALGALILLILTHLGEVVRRWRWADDDGRTLIAFSFSLWLLFMGHAASEPVFTEPQMIMTIWIAMLLPALVVRRPEHVRAPLRRPKPSSAPAPATRPARTRLAPDPVAH